MLKILNLDFSFSRNNKILNNISLEIKNKNQIIALLGPNGAGKTTLLNAIADVYQKYTGKIIKGNNRIFLIPDAEFIPKEMTIKTCMKEFSVLYEDFNVTRAKKMLDYLKIDDNKKIADYSKGMKEQIHLVFGLAHDVDFYLFDEPLAAVDPLTRDTMIYLIENFRKANSLAIISTHIVSDMEKIFDEVIFINDGKILLYEETEKLRKQYQDRKLDEIFKEVNKVC
ncbi:MULTISPECIES: ABC transporter ATP-binding protein [unclassified Gemella]|uniref:ATP-binding cassette domain-containing protein n=1 Tax=unclassified Gemella TaxID=2624949 RepID=UPI0010735BA8|nr:MULTISPECIES: ABC transporter ATP-binding protein [unclassified Gemella]MBF0709682.1 ABC transporter ATP-binding protein [Gemella sp. GL1.1]MBF0746899.1 ABC transporter ATP-binding protein [Gemella sp. 19428wG2_WT2a]NYS27026.1 ABC transporter ATP-binding protein [Gemella sp. GL1]TFU59125.1 ABC transporter ATP-binding protein [Gemella sp. WT2a]